MSCNTVVRSCATFTQEHFVEANDGVYKLSTLVASIFDFMGKASSSLLTSLANVTHVIKLTAGVTALISLFCYLYKVTKSGAKGTWMAVASTVTLVMHKLAFFATSLHNFKFISIGNALKPLAIFGTITGLFSSIFDIGDQAHLIHRSKQKIQKLIGYREKWCRIKEDFLKPAQKAVRACGWICNSPGDYSLGMLARGNKEKLDKLKAQPQTTEQQKIIIKLESRYERYDAVLNCKNLDKRKLYCRTQIDLLTEQINHEPKSQKISWMYIAFDVVFIALCIMTLLVPAPVLLIASLSIAALAVASSALDLTSFSTKILLKKKTWPKVNIGIFADSYELSKDERRVLNLP